MKRVALFQKVSRERYFEDCPRDDVEEIYNSIKLPSRATALSAGYDFYIPYTVDLAPGESIKVPTGIRVKINDNWVLKMYPRSSLGFKYRIQLDNTVGIIDADYYNSDNEGHIFVKLTNDSRDARTCRMEAGTAFVQGIFIEYGISFDDDVSTVRNGGLGSTNR